MAGTWQLLILGAYSLALVAVATHCQQLGDRSTPKHLRANQLESSRPTTDGGLVQAASAPMGLAYSPPINSQPSVYHSIIDRTASTSAAGSAPGLARRASPAVQTSTATIGDLNTAAGHHHGHAHGKYYQYAAVPKKKTWKAGYKRGNHKHTISRHEHGKAGKHPHFKAKVKWHDSKSKGKGIHLWDYNHHDKKHYHHHG